MELASTLGDVGGALPSVIGTLTIGAGIGPGPGLRWAPGRRAGAWLGAADGVVVPVPGSAGAAAGGGVGAGGAESTAARPPLIATNAPAAPPASNNATPVSGTSRDGVGTGGVPGANSSVNATASLAARRLARS